MAALWPGRGVGLRPMIFERMRSQMKWIIVVVAVAFAVTLLYVGVPFLQGGGGGAQAAIAEVNGQAIDQISFQAAYLNALRQYEQALGTVRATDIEEIRYNALSSLIDVQLILQAARDEGVKVSRRDVDARFREIRDSFPSQQEFRRQLELANMNEQTLRRAIEEGLMAEKLQEKLAAGVQVTDEDVARAYEQVKVRQIVLNPKTTDQAGWNEAKKRADEAHRQLRSGADFAKVASQTSDDELTRSQGGDIGMVGRGALPEPVEEKAFALSVGAFSEPIKTDDAYVIVQVTERREPKGPDYEKEKATLAEEVRKEKADAAFEKWFSDLRQQASITILDPQLAARDALVRGEFDRALDLYKEAAARSPEDPYVQYGMGITLNALKHQDEALSSFQKAAELAPGDAVIHLALGNAYQQKGDKQKAAEALRKASELSPMDMQMHLTLYLMFSDLGLKEDAEREQQELEKIQKVAEEQRKQQEELLKQLQEQQSQSQQSSSEEKQGEQPAQEP